MNRLCKILAGISILALQGSGYAASPQMAHKPAVKKTDQEFMIPSVPSAPVEGPVSFAFLNALFGPGSFPETEYLATFSETSFPWLNLGDSHCRGHSLVIENDLEKIIVDRCSTEEMMSPFIDGSSKYTGIHLIAKNGSVPEHWNASPNLLAELGYMQKERGFMEITLGLEPDGFYGDPDSLDRKEEFTNFYNLVNRMYSSALRQLLVLDVSKVVSK